MASDEGFAVSSPPHARLAALRFDDAARSLLATLANTAERVVRADQIASLRGGRIHNDLIAPIALTSQFDPANRILRPAIGAGADDVIEELSFVLGLRIRDVAELWYLVADSFNFRSALGADAGLVTEPNFRALVVRLASFAPMATRDAFVDAVLQHTNLPPPLDSLPDFLKAAV